MNQLFHFVLLLLVTASCCAVSRQEEKNMAPLPDLKTASRIGREVQESQHLFSHECGIFCRGRTALYDFRFVTFNELNIPQTRAVILKLINELIEKLAQEPGMSLLCLKDKTYKDVIRRSLCIELTMGKKETFKNSNNNIQHNVLFRDDVLYYVKVNHKQSLEASVVLKESYEEAKKQFQAQPDMPHLTLSGDESVKA